MPTRLLCTCTHLDVQADGTVVHLNPVQESGSCPDIAPGLPSGAIALRVVNGQPAASAFVSGQRYTVTIDADA